MLTADNGVGGGTADDGVGEGTADDGAGEGTQIFIFVVLADDDQD